MGVSDPPLDAGSASPSEAGELAVGAALPLVVVLLVLCCVESPEVDEHAVSEAARTTEAKAMRVAMSEG